MPVRVLISPLIYCNAECPFQNIEAQRWCFHCRICASFIYQHCCRIFFLDDRSGISVRPRASTCTWFSGTFLTALLAWQAFEWEPQVAPLTFCLSFFLPTYFSSAPTANGSPDPPWGPGVNRGCKFQGDPFPVRHRLRSIVCSL